MRTVEAWRACTQFMHEISWEAIPADVQHMASRCLLDLTGTLIAGSRTDLSRIVRQVAAASYGGEQATLLLDGRRTSAAGAALANGMTIDAIDAHDGYRLAKGHVGAGVYPAALAIGERLDWSGAQLLAAMVVGYEIGLRAAEALHQRAAEYYSSGSWLALGAASVAARGWGLTPQASRHALGIADYHSPRSEMMRCIDHPTMLKDGIGWGAMTGVLAAELAAAGFSGAPAGTLEQEQLGAVWQDLGADWRMRKLYFKPYACCRWAQPAIDAALALTRAHGVQADQIAGLEVWTFEEATRLGVRRPQNTEQAQYSLPYPLAAALRHGQLDPIHVQPPYLDDERILQLAELVTLRVDPALDARFPAEALARVRLTADNGRVLESGTVAAEGDPHNPLSDDQLNQKFQRAASAHLRPERAGAVREACWNCAQLDSIGELVALLAEAPAGAGA